MTITPQSIWRDEDGNELRVVAVVDGTPFVKPKNRPLSASIQTDPAWFTVWTQVSA